MDQALLDHYPKCSMSLLPTPIHYLHSVSREYRASIYCKRDDMTGFAFGGNKTRKLDYLIADALKLNADTLIALGANQSNFCRMAAAAGAANSLEVHLVLGGKQPRNPTGNLLLDHLFEARIHHVDSLCWQRWEEEGRRLQKQLTSEGHTVYWLPVGGSTPIGALGYVATFLEIMDYSREADIPFSTIIHASSSGGTQAGLVVGKHLTGWPGRIIGMGAAKSSPVLQDEVLDLAGRTGELLGVTVDRSSVIVESSFMGDTYAARTPACSRAITLFAAREGILLDHVYTGKAAAGLLDYAARGEFRREENVLFIHTGGNIQLFE